MTRKHYEAIAKALAYTRPLNTETAAYRNWVAIVENLCAQFKTMNHRFDWERFVEACNK